MNKKIGNKRPGKKIWYSRPIDQALEGVRRCGYVWRSELCPGLAHVGEGSIKMRKLVLLSSEVIGSIAALASTLVLAGLLMIPSPGIGYTVTGAVGHSGELPVLGGTGIVSTGDTVLNADLARQSQQFDHGVSPRISRGRRRCHARR